MVARPHHLLVIDDEPFIGRIVRLEFEQGPYRVSIASDGDEGLAFLRANPDVDLVLLDVNMPTRSGLDVLAEAKADPALGKVPFVVLTAAGQSAYFERAKVARRRGVPHQAVLAQEAGPPGGGDPRRATPTPLAPEDG